jgi:prepilin-type N-terminal cleavage/methylation domain-containing protein
MLNRLRAARERSDDGFTLIELLLVIIILGVLAGIVVFAVNGISDRGHASACKSDKKNVEIASEAYFSKWGEYAVTVERPRQADELRPHDLVFSGFLREKPGNNGYNVIYHYNQPEDPANKNGSVSADIC